MRHQLTLALAVLITLPAFADERPVYPCFEVGEAPAIDGVVEGDGAWANVPRVGGFYALGGGYTVAKQSSALVCRDAGHLYVAMVCEEPDSAQMQPQLGDGDAVWMEDSVEIFVEPGRGGVAYQFVVGAGGARLGARGAELVEGWQAAAHRGEGDYSIELSIPLAGFDRKLDAQWRIAFCRNIYTTASGGDKFTCWPALRAAFYEPSSYAGLDLRRETPSAELRAAAERELNAEYRAYLVAQVRELAPAGEQFLPTLRQAATTDGDPLQADAQRTVLAWARVQQAADGAADAGIGELRDAAVLARELRERSYQLAWQHQMEQLLRAAGR